jgi:hypothetical protein
MSQPADSAIAEDVPYVQPDDYNATVHDIDNPQWEALGRRWRTQARAWREPTVLVPHPPGHARAGENDYVSSYQLRETLVKRFCWSVTAPATVDFVAEHAGEQLLDPLAGTGYWAYLLRQCGVGVVAADLYGGVSGKANPWHGTVRPWADVERGDALDTLAAMGGAPGHTLLLAWPPYNEPVAALALAAYTGTRVIYIGEEWGCTADEEFHRRLESQWRLVAAHVPVCWDGIHDRVLVYERNPTDTELEPCTCPAP